jgi:plasmid stability protein
MGNIQIKNVPEEIHDELRRRAAEEGISLRDYVLRLIRHDMSRASLHQWRQSLSQLPKTRLDRPAAEYIRKAREERDRQLQRVVDDRRR